MARDQIHFPIGQFLPGTKYKVVRKLGQGGMGVALEVVKEPGLKAVIKIIHPSIAAVPDFRQRFVDEVRILAKLEHPNIVRVLDYDELTDGTPYIVMELLRGGTVQASLRQASTLQSGNLYLIMYGLMEGLGYIHAQDPPIVHRDVKAENLFIHVPETGEHCVKLIDFGIAAGGAFKDARGTFVGTPRYAAPEQLRGEPATSKVDLYAAGLMLYQGLAGRGPFDDVPLVPEDRGQRQMAFIRAHLTLPAPPIRTFAPWVPKEIDALLQSALAKDPGERPETAYAFASRLYMLQFIGSTPIGANTTAKTLSTMVSGTPSTSGLADLLRDHPGGSSDDKTPSDNAPSTTARPQRRVAQATFEEPERSLESFGLASLESDEAKLSEERSAPELAAAPPRSFADKEAAVRHRAHTHAPALVAETPPNRPRDIPAALNDTATGSSLSTRATRTSQASQARWGLSGTGRLFLALLVCLPVLTVAWLASMRTPKKSDAPSGGPTEVSAATPSASSIHLLPPEESALPARTDPGPTAPGSETPSALAVVPPAPSQPHPSATTVRAAPPPTPPQHQPASLRHDLDPGGSPL